VDGDTTQIDAIKQAAKQYGATVVVILDIIHVLEYLWKAANALFDPEDANGAWWVADRIEQLLQGQRTSMVRGLRRAATVKGLNPKQREPIEQCITYLTNHAPYLNYPHYLAKGYPIATGVIEGACRYVVKDRMEITGARWGLEGGEAVLKLRALYLNGISRRTGHSTNNRSINAITKPNFQRCPKRDHTCSSSLPEKADGTTLPDRRLENQGLRRRRKRAAPHHYNTAGPAILVYQHTGGRSPFLPRP